MDHRKHTLAEVLAIVIGVAILVFLALPVPMDSDRTNRSSCANNLKQISIEFRLYANDNANRFPMQISVKEGGSLEFSDNSEEAWRHFWAACKDLSNPKILKCPADAVTNQPPEDFTLPGDDKVVSYFIALDSVPEKTDAILSGDADVFLDGKLLPKSSILPNRSGYRWGNRHKKGGVVAFADGAVSFLTSTRLNAAVQKHHNAGLVKPD